MREYKLTTMHAKKATTNFIFIDCLSNTQYQCVLSVEFPALLYEVVKTIA